MNCLWTIAFAAVCAALPSVAVSQTGVQLVTVPLRVVLPAPSGSNLLLEVAVDGAPSRVWLSRTEDDRGGVDLSPAGSGRFQLNLADARVLALVGAGDASGSFRVLAQIGAAVVPSAAIAWSRGDAQMVRARCFVVGGGEAPTATGGDGLPWLAVALADRIEVHGVAAPVARAKLVAGTTDVPLTWRGGEQGFALDLNDGLRAALQGVAACTVDVRAGDELVQFLFHVVPDRIEGDLGTRFSVMQRRSAFLPGTRDWLEVRIDDITMGQVALTVRDAAGRAVVAERLVAEHDDVPFTLGDRSYVLLIDRLRNQLIGDDWAELSVHLAAGFRADPIARLIRRIEAAQVVFVREGVDHVPATAAQLMRARLGSHRGPALSPRECVDLCARSSRTGEPYHVRLPDGTLVPAPEWLQEQLAAVEREIAAGLAESKR